MKFAKLICFLAISSLLFSGCNMPRSRVSPLRTSTPNTGLLPTSEPTLIPGEPLYWIQLAYNSEELANYTNGQEDRPRLALVRDPAEIPAIGKWILPQDLPRLQKVDYSAMLVVIVFSGVQGTDQHEILVDQVVTNGDEVIVSATFTSPPEGVPLSPTLTSPYLVFEVQKMDLPENPDFVLKANGEEIDRVSLHTLDPYPGSFAQAYPQPPTPPQLQAPTSSPEGPIHTLPGATPFPVDQSFNQAALSYITQHMGIDPGSLSIVETSTIILPITQKSLWNGILVHPNQNGGNVYQVLIDADQRVILNGLNFDPQTYWDQAESLFRQANRDSILSQISQLNDIPAAELTIVSGVFHRYPLTQTIIWHGKILSESGDEFDYAVSLDGNPVDPGMIEAKESEARWLKYGKLGENLYYILQAIPDDHSVEVALATSGSDLGEIAEKLKEDFPEIKAAYFAGGIPVDSDGKPEQVDRETLDKIRDRYLEYLSQGTIEPKIPVLNYLKAIGYEPRDVYGVNIIDARMTKRDILLLSQAPLDSLGSIHYSGQIPQP